MRIYLRTFPLLQILGNRIKSPAVITPAIDLTLKQDRLPLRSNKDFTPSLISSDFF